MKIKGEIAMNNYFSVMSLNLVAWLISKDFEIIETALINNQVTFFFEKSPELSEAINDYNNNIELKKFLGAFKQVKQIMYKTKN